jgi:hypothetical protein
MTRLNTEKLYTTFGYGVTPTKPIIPRKYTLTHSDVTANLYLNIGKEYAYDKINRMRDEVLGEWINTNDKYTLNINLYVGDFGPVFTAIRNAIFRRELPLALEAIVYGDKKFFEAHPELYNSPIIVHFNSAMTYYNRIENWGTPNNYK